MQLNMGFESEPASRGPLSQRSTLWSVRRLRRDSAGEAEPVSYVTVLHGEGVNYDELFAADSAIVCGDAERVLLAMPAQSAQSIVTSPPYWSLRDYGIEGQIGLEESVEQFIKRLVQVFDQAFRVLRDDGTMWLNIGDSYTSGGRTWASGDFGLL